MCRCTNGRTPAIYKAAITVVCHHTLRFIVLAQSVFVDKIILIIVFMKLNVHCCVQKSLPLDAEEGQMEPVHRATPCFLKVHFNRNTDTGYTVD